MKTRIGISLVIFTFVFTSFGEKARDDNTMTNLTIEAVALISKEISGGLDSFRKEKAPRILEEMIERMVQLKREKLASKEWPAIRKLQTETWLRMLKAVDQEIDRNHESASPPERNVAVPGPYPSGTAPESIKEPEIRREYEEAMAVAEKARKEYVFQQKLRILRRQLLDQAEDFAVGAYSKPPSATNELRELLRTYTVDPALGDRILKKTEQPSDDAH
ncbi:MAG TPA: hypothetical protein P5026_04475 [Kiritimatiellia bacterium]|nr:hypothetical protein [Kiritimatiellia bacterium]HRU70311.1 hypothetical protein [Kiritimatiellia bacterium]